MSSAVLFLPDTYIKIEYGFYRISTLVDVHGKRLTAMSILCSGVETRGAESGLHYRFISQEQDGAGGYLYGIYDNWVENTLSVTSTRLNEGVISLIEGPRIEDWHKRIATYGDWTAARNSGSERIAPGIGYQQVIMTALTKHRFSNANAPLPTIIRAAEACGFSNSRTAYEKALAELNKIMRDIRFDQTEHHAMVGSW